jgi:hypothetical protein
MPKKYNILWIDDEHEKMNGFKLQAAQNDILLKPYKSKNAGILEIQNNYPLYDGVLFDAKFFEDEDDTAGSEDLSALSNAKNSLLQLPKKFELFILTGQAQLFDDKTFNTFVPKYYRKGIADDVNKLFLDLKASADKQIDTQIRHDYLRLFEICKNNYIGEATSVKILGLLKQVELNQEIDLINSFNELRGILELLFGKLNSLKLIPDKILKSKGWINQSSIFLSGKHSVYKWHNEKNPIHPTIAFLIYQFLQITQDGSHELSDQLQLKINDFVSSNKTVYLYKSTLFQLLDILIYFKKFIDDNSNEAENLKLWYEEIEISGDRIKAIILHGNNGWGNVLLKDDTTKIGIPKPMMESNNLTVGDEIEFTPKYDESKGRYHIENIKKV